MSHLISTKVEGLAGRKRPVEIVFDRHTNVIFGVNGSGKTSLLKILHSAMSGDATILENVPFTDASVQIYSKKYDRVFTRTINISEYAKSQEEITPSLPGQLEMGTQYYNFLTMTVTQGRGGPRWKQTPAEEKKTETELTSWAHRYLPTARLHISDEPFLGLSPTQLQRTLTEDMLDKFFADSVQKLWMRYSSRVVRDVRDAQARGLASILRAVLSSARRPRRAPALDMAKAYESVKNFLQRQGSPRLLGDPTEFQKRYREDPSLRSIVQDIYQVEQDIDCAMASRLQLQQLIEHLYSGSKHVAFGDDQIQVTTGDGKQIGLTSLSSGEKHLMRILVEALLADEDAILVDEPELSMHIDWQRDLISNLRLLNHSAQFVLATHSPEVMADIPDANIFSL
jgi:ABC-type lipoprotein export system ATPase subunit